MGTYTILKGKATCYFKTLPCWGEEEKHLKVSLHRLMPLIGQYQLTLKGLKEKLWEKSNVLYTDKKKGITSVFSVYYTTDWWSLIQNACYQKYFKLQIFLYIWNICIILTGLASLIQKPKIWNDSIAFPLNIMWAFTQFWILEDFKFQIFGLKILSL